jgi:hypothetical protein
MSLDEARVRDVRRTPVVLFHVSPAVNRVSILSHGLDVSRMGLATGIAGSLEPEKEGVHLVERLDLALWYASFPQHAAVDIWEARVDGLVLVESNDEWLCRDLIPPDRLSLVETALTPKDAATRLEGDAQRRAKLDTSDDADLRGDLRVVFKPVDQQDDETHS